LAMVCAARSADCGDESSFLEWRLSGDKDAGGSLLRAHPPGASDWR
jgi:hypothetical protein